MEIDKLPASKMSARKVGSKYYFTSIPCKYGHVSARYVCDGGCTECVKSYHIKNKERISERHANYRNNNIQAIAAQTQGYHRANAAHILQKNREYYATRRDELVERQRKYNKENSSSIAIQKKIYRNKYPERVAARNVLYQMKKADATPRYVSDTHYRSVLEGKIRDTEADKKRFKKIRMYHAAKILGLFAEARRLETLHGVRYNVDHVLPINHKYQHMFTALHVAENLRVITRQENMQKLNKVNVNDPELYYVLQSSEN